MCTPAVISSRVSISCVDSWIWTWTPEAQEEEAQKSLEEAHAVAKLQAKAAVIEERTAHIEELKHVNLQVLISHGGLTR